MKKKRKVVVVCGEHRHEVEISGSEKKLTIFKLGNKKSGWIPNQSHFHIFRDNLDKAIKDPKHVIIFHYGVEVEQVTL